MSYKCVLCNKAFVDQPGDICISCQMKHTAPVQSGQPDNNKSVPIEASNPIPQILPKNDVPNPVNISPVDNDYNQGKTATKENGTYSGIVQNLMTNPVTGTTMSRWMNSLIYGYPYSTGNNQFVFSLFSQDAYSGAGVSGHSVMFYGNAEYSFLSNNTPVIVHGNKMSDGVILANKVEGSNYGFTMKSRFSLSSAAVRIITFLIIAIIAIVTFALVHSFTENNHSKINQTEVSTDSGAANSDISTGLTPTNNPRLQGLGILTLLAGGFCLIKRTPVSKRAATIMCIIGAGLIYPLLMALLILYLLIKFFMKFK